MTGHNLARTIERNSISRRTAVHLCEMCRNLDGISGNASRGMPRALCIRHAVANVADCRNHASNEDTQMLYWTIVFLIIALVAGVLGFTGIYAAAAGIAKILFFIFVVLFLISLVAGGLNRRSLP